MNTITSKQFKLSYQSPYAWSKLFAFLQARVIEGLERVEVLSEARQRYSRTIQYQSVCGYFKVENNTCECCLDVDVFLNDLQAFEVIVERIKTIFDIDAPIQQIDQQLECHLGDAIDYHQGLRVPGVWGYFEAGVRAILGQQVSVLAARRLVQVFVENLGENLGEKVEQHQNHLSYLFPRPDVVIDSDLDFFRMPQARKDCLRALAEHFINAENPHDVDAWINIKGIGPWTINYVKMRAAKDPDIWLVGDAGLNNALKKIPSPPDIEKLKPWRSYATFQLWNQL